ncbi:hypothetical protein [Crenalkalicoccus roseus]|uniref:hypothetical protein n=1 Tax=Crenalkalicoccus roseus TaxID=1485588 RepID=UPI001305348F|nr:hypothetical protein [Crenalkalicoccus roseus]
MPDMPDARADALPTARRREGRPRARHGRGAARGVVLALLLSLPAWLGLGALARRLIG